MKCSTGVISVLLMMGGLVGCDLLTGPDQTVVGILEWVPDEGAQIAASERETFSRDADAPLAYDTLETCCDTRLQAPDTVTAGEEFEVVVTTIGWDSGWVVDRTELEISGNEAVITPYDDPRRDEVEVVYPATQELEHRVSVVFPNAGDALIEVRGQRVVGDDLEDGTPVTIEHSVYVRP